MEEPKNNQSGDPWTSDPANANVIANSKKKTMILLGAALLLILITLAGLWWLFVSLTPITNN